jgi:hypothetical protein
VTQYKILHEDAADHSNSILHHFATALKRSDKQKIAIIGLWFLILTVTCVLLGYALKDIWIGTFGAVALSFIVFCLTIRYTPLQRYRPKVNAILSQRYRRNIFSFQR